MKIAFKRLGFARGRRCGPIQNAHVLRVRSASESDRITTLRRNLSV
jgi:hypothetical protein